MDARALLLTALLVTTSLAWLPASQGHPEEDLPNDIDIHETFEGDTFGIAIRSDSAFRVLNKSHFQVTGDFSNGTNGTAGPQNIGALVGVVQYFRGGCGGCIFSMVGHSVKDEADVRVATDGPVTYTFETDPDRFQNGKLTVGVKYDQDTWFEGPQGDADQVTYRFFVSIPGVSELDVNLHLHVNKPVEVLSNTSHDGGFLLTDEDFEPATHADTMAANAMVDGQATIDLAPSNSDRVYGYMSPAWFGSSGVAPFGFGVGATTNTAATGIYGFQAPDGQPKTSFCVVAGFPCGPTLLGMTQTGTYEFFVDAQANAGPSDMYVVGFEGPPN